MAEKTNKDLVAIGEMIIIRFEEVKKERPKTASGIELIVPDNDKPVHEAIIETIGDRVPKDIEFKVGDSVVFNDHDVKMFETENPKDALKPIMKGITKYQSIWAVYK